jgi:hypothetical protein
MTNLVGGMAIDEENDDPYAAKEMADLTREVSFGATPILGPAIPPPVTPPNVGNRQGNLISESLRGAFEAAIQRPLSAGPGPPLVWYGLKDEAGDRLVLGDHAQVHEFVASGQFQVRSLFGSLPEAQAWMITKSTAPGKRNAKTAKAGKSPNVIRIPDSSSDSSANGSPPRSSAVAARRREQAGRRGRRNPPPAPRTRGRGRRRGRKGSAARPVVKDIRPHPLQTAAPQTATLPPMTPLTKTEGRQRRKDARRPRSPPSLKDPIRR